MPIKKTFFALPNVIQRGVNAQTSEENDSDNRSRADSYWIRSDSIGISIRSTKSYENLGYGMTSGFRVLNLIRSYYRNLIESQRTTLIDSYYW